jgi:carbamoylphosphate synthase large subunit
LADKSRTTSPWDSTNTSVPSLLISPSTPDLLQGANILGTSAENINKAEDRHLFSAMLDKLKVDQPKWKELTAESDVFAFAAEVGYPVSVPPPRMRVK